MLSRVANSLYWMGRYIERSEHQARYMNVNYFSSLDAPINISQSRQFVLESMLYMSGVSLPQESLKEQEVLFKLGLDAKCPSSLLSMITQARENARGSRDMLSSELWEAVNKFYHYINNYPNEVYIKTGLHDLTTSVIEQSTVIRGKVMVSLLHDEAMALIMLGIYLERAVQIVRIMGAKLNDIQRIKKMQPDVADLTYEYTTMLGCTESLDMLKRYYKNFPDKHKTIEFLLLINDSPRSVVHCLNQVKRYFNRITKQKYPDRDSVGFLIGKMAAEYNYIRLPDVEKSLPVFIDKTIDRLFSIGQELEKEYLQG